MIGKLLLSVLAFVATSVAQRPAVESTPREGLPNFYAKLESKAEEVRIAYLGGSITAQEGYRVYSRDFFQKEYPDTRIVGINAAIGGTGSDLGVLRCGHDVISQHPDLVFVEFAVNDRITSVIEIRRNMEGIVRQIWAADPTTDILFVYTFRIGDDSLGQLCQGKMMMSSSVMEEIADHYGIPSIDMGISVAEMYNQGKIVMQASKEGMSRVSGDELNEVSMPVDGEGRIPFSRDGTHPYVDTGHRLYMNAIERSLPAIKAAGKAQAHTLPEPMMADCRTDISTVQLDDKMLKLSGEYAQNEPSDAVTGKFSSFCESFHTFKPGSSISFSFKGKGAYIYDVMGPSAGTISVSVDCGTPVQYKRFDGYCHYYRLSLVQLCGGLDPAQTHTVTIDVLDTPIDKYSILHQQSRKYYDNDPQAFAPLNFYPGCIFIEGELCKWTKPKAQKSKARIVEVNFRNEDDTETVWPFTEKKPSPNYNYSPYDFSTEQFEEFTVKCSKRIYCNPTNGWEISGGNGDYLMLPSFSGKKLVKVVYVPGASGYNGHPTIRHEQNWEIVPGGEEAKKMFAAGVPYTWELFDTVPRERYRIVMGAESKLFIKKLILYYE